MFIENPKLESGENKMGMDLHTYIGPFIQIKQSPQLNNFLQTPEMEDVFINTRSPNDDLQTFLISNGGRNRNFGITTDKYSDEFAKQLNSEEQVGEFKLEFQKEIEELRKIDYNTWVKFGVVTFFM